MTFKRGLLFNGFCQSMQSMKTAKKSYNTGQFRKILSKLTFSVEDNRCKSLLRLSENLKFF